MLITIGKINCLYSTALWCFIIAYAVFIITYATMLIKRFLEMERGHSREVKSDVLSFMTEIVSSKEKF